MSVKSRLHILLVGGGTGGHIYPLVSVAQTLQQQAQQKQLELDLRYFGDPGGYEEYLVQHAIRVSHIASSKLRRYASILNFLDFFKFFWGFFVALFKLYFFMPEVVFSKSGPGTLSIIYAARFYRIPVIIHESDAIPGLTNKVSAKHSVIVELAFEHAKQYFAAADSAPITNADQTQIKSRGRAGKPIVNVVGLPVREAVINTQSPAQCRKIFGLSDEKPILFIVGGSQGAQILNEFVLSNIERLLAQFEVIHQVGKENFDTYTKEFGFVTKHFKPELLARYQPFAFLSDEQMSAALGAADIVISRAGSSIFEIAANAKPSLLIPLASSANNHQFENAYAYSQAGACIVIEEANLLPGLVINQLQKLVDEPEFAQKMSQAARQFYRPNAASDIAKDILSTVGV